MPIYPSGWIATVVSVLAEWANAPLADGLFKISANAPVPGNSQHIYHFEARCCLLGFIFTHLDILWRNWVIVPTWVQICTNRTSANICRPKHRMLTLILRGEGWSQGDPSRLGRSATHMQHLSTCCYTIPSLLLASLPASWLGSITLGDTVTWGVGTTGTIFTSTQLITRCI